MPPLMPVNWPQVSSSTILFVGTKGQLVFLPSSALRLGNFEKISDVQQGLVDVFPKALGILWA